MNTIFKTHLKNTNGGEVIEEAVSLLSQMCVSPNRGGCAQGKHVAIIVDPEWNDDKETIQIHITCYAFGHRHVDWKGLPIFILARNRDNIGSVVLLNTRGQAIVHKLPPCEYTLTVSNRWLIGDVVISENSLVTMRTEIQELAQLVPCIIALPTQQIIDRALAALEISVPQQSLVSMLENPRVYEIPDIKLRATLSPVNGDLEVAFETDDKNVADMKVFFAFAQVSMGTIVHSGFVTLEHVSNKIDLWEGVWKGSIEIPEPCYFIFNILPRGGKEK